jgi:hypothetical protein
MLFIDEIMAKTIENIGIKRYNRMNKDYTCSLIEK